MANNTSYMVAKHAPKILSGISFDASILAVTLAFDRSALAPVNRAPTVVAGRVATEMDETLISATHDL